MSRSSLLCLALFAAACTPKDEADTGLNDSEVLTPTDEDGDGFTSEEGDCDDSDAAVNPGASEICDGLDNDCDGEADEDVSTTWYADADGDGYGDEGAATEACEAPEGAVAVGGDCDDADAAYNPGAPEIDCADPNDYNCDGSVGYADADGDGYPACEDCDDSEAAVNPAAAEVCDDIDNDCDGQTDDADDSLDASTASAWYGDYDRDGYGDDGLLQLACEQPGSTSAQGGDCDDGDAAVNPAASEVCNNTDDDCDGLIDDADDSLDASTGGTFYGDADGDGYGDASASTQACESPSGAVADDSDCDDALAEVNPGASEVCNDVDDDCDGLIDDADDSLDSSTGATFYDDDDGDGYGDSSASSEACEQPSGAVSDDSDCDDSDAAVNPSATELCNSVDDDCDGAVDEPDAADASTWYADSDSDSYGDASVSTLDCDQPSGYVADDTDCDDGDASVYPGALEAWHDEVDADCDGDADPDICVDVPTGATVPDDPSCVAPLTTSSSWSVVTEWETDTWGYSAGNSYSRIMMAPAVGNLTDDNGDGVVDALDTPDVAYNTFTGGSYTAAGYLRVMSADLDGVVTEHLSLTSVVDASGASHSIASSGGVALGDVDADGLPDIVTTTTGSRIVALSPDGTVLWVSASAASSYYAQPSIADMNNDGQPEVLAANLLVDGATGATITTFNANGRNVSYAADIDDDGELEAVFGDAVYEMDGTLLWDRAITDGHSAAVNLDGDDFGEVVMHANGIIYAFDHDGTTLWTYSTGDSGYGAPCAADIDGDGVVEIGAGGRYAFTVVDATGALEWTASTRDASSRSASCTTFDFEADGAAEFVYADELNLYVFDGAGATVFQESSHASGTIYEHPLVADVDNDGNAEIVLPTNNYAYSGWDGLYVLGEENDQWASARPVWNQHAYHQSNINDDLSVPSPQDLPWTDHNSFRGQASAGPAIDSAPDLAVGILDVCEDCSAGSLEVYVAIDNLGAVFVPAGVSVALYADDNGSRTLLDVATTTERCEVGERLAPLSFLITPGDVGATGIVAVVDDDGAGAGAHTECDESNNEETWDALTCGN